MSSHLAEWRVLIQIGLIFVPFVSHSVSVIGWISVVCSMNKCPFGESHGHKTKFLYYGRKPPLNFFSSFKMFKLGGGGMCL